MKVDDHELTHLARLARLRLEDDEREGLRGDLERVLAHLGELTEIDVDGLEPMLRPLHVEDGTRADVVQAGLVPERARDQARARSGEFVRVPRTGGDDG
ncbi:MAG: Asp-tRNA(Asn)/Glu-tRNA(Gln) amidotransferase subunit GatC [Trueperaceae bacterium]|nr:Asp-tRNA(Asn)/Glu-tRNA(Gln) amidotransferase subunit GatC [Trueperaceae bacterium]